MKNIRTTVKQFNKISIKLLLLMIAIILPLDVISIYYSNKYANYIREQTVERTVNQLKKSEDEFYLIFKRMVDIAGIICNNSTFQRAIENEELSLYEKTKVFDEAVNAIVINNLYDMADIKITCFDIDSNTYSNWGTNYNSYEFLFEQDWVKKSIESHGYVQWNLFEPSYVLEEGSDIKYISLARSLLNSSGQRIATIIVSLRQESLSSALRHYLSSEKDAIFICNESGNIVLGVDDHSIFSHDIISEKALSDGKTGFGYIENGETTYLYSFYTLDRRFTVNGEALRVIQITSYDDLIVDVSSMHSRINAMLIISLVIMIIVITWFANYWTRPITCLADKLRTYQIGNEVSGLDFEREDEIGDVNRAFQYMCETNCSLMKKQLAEQEAKEKYQYESLRAQINPHFLFNTLNTIKWMAIIRKADNIVNCIDAMATMMKYSMSRGDELVHLNEEIDNIESYVYITNARYGNNISLIINLEDRILELQVIKFILQPSVENAIIHGFNNSERKGEIVVSGHIAADYLSILIEDNGIGIDEKKVEDIKKNKKVTGLGIKNINDRIKASFGDRYGIEIRRKEPTGTIVEYILPIISKRRSTDEESNDR